MMGLYSPAPDTCDTQKGAPLSPTAGEGGSLCLRAGVVPPPAPDNSLIPQGKLTPVPHGPVLRDQTFRWNSKEKSPPVRVVQFSGETLSLLEKTKN